LLHVRTIQVAIYFILYKGRRQEGEEGKKNKKDAMDIKKRDIQLKHCVRTSNKITVY